VKKPPRRVTSSTSISEILSISWTTTQWLLNGGVSSQVLRLLLIFRFLAPLTLRVPSDGDGLALGSSLESRLAGGSHISFCIMGSRTPRKVSIPSSGRTPTDHCTASTDPFFGSNLGRDPRSCPTPALDHRLLALNKFSEVKVDDEQLAVVHHRL